MRIEQLEYLIALSRHSSFNAASEELHISHQCLNKAISTLEKELGTTLVNRSTKGISLTTTGKKTVDTAKDILRNLDQLKNFIQDQEQNKEPLLKGNISVIGTACTINILLTPLVCEMKKIHPNVKIHLIEAAPSVIPSMLLSEKYDFAVVNLPEKTVFDEKIAVTVLYRENLIGLVGKYSELGNLSKISLREFLQKPILIYNVSRDKRDLTYDVLENYGTLKNFVYTNNLQILNECISNNLYYTVTTPTAFLGTPFVYQSQVKILSLKEQIVSATFLLQTKHNKKNEVVDAVLELLKKQYHILESSILNLSKL